MKVHLLEGRAPNIPQLYDFIGPRSWLFFDKNEIDTAWLSIHVDQWLADAGLQQIKQPASHTNVLNDSAARAVKDITDFANHPHDPQRRDEVVQVVNSHLELIDFRHLTKYDLAQL